LHEKIHPPSKLAQQSFQLKLLYELLIHNESTTCLLRRMIPPQVSSPSLRALVQMKVDKCSSTHRISNHC